MTPLRARFIAHLELKGYAAKTRKNYLQPVIQFSRWLKRSPDTLTKEELQRYLLYLKLERKLAIRSLNIHIYALKCFCDFVLPEADIMAPYKRLKEPKYQPDVLSREEVIAIIDTETNLKYKAIIAILYASGIRLEECVALDINDIDSARMVIHVRNGKGGKERISILSNKALAILREYWILYKPRTCLFEGNVKGKRINRRTVEEIVAIAAFKTGLRKRLKTHSLRHSFATHMLEDGVPLQVIQRLLGHERIDTTNIYTHVSTSMLTNVKSPLDVKTQPKPQDDILASVPKKRGRPPKTNGDQNFNKAATKPKKQTPAAAKRKKGGRK
jgi:integrase/recombinase XerD